MKTSGTFTLHRFTIPLRKIGSPVKLIFFGDVHRDSPTHALSHWKEFLRYAKQNVANSYFIGMGDYLDATSTSERIGLRSIKHLLHDTERVAREERSRKCVEDFANEIGFMKGRLVGLLNGNHYHEFEDGTNSDQYLCRLLGCKYLGVSSFVRLSFDNHGSSLTLDGWLHHGAGGARLPGGSVNRVAQMSEIAEADFFASGHDHRRGVWPCNPRLSLEADHRTPSGLRLRERQGWLIKSGSFLAAYEDNVASYNVDAGRGPCSLGHAELEVRMTRHRAKPDVDVRTLEVRGIA